MISHYHADHIYGLEAFRDHTDAVIVAQTRALDYTSDGNIDDEKALPRLAQRREVLAPWVDSKTRIVEPGLVFRDLAEIRLGSHSFQLRYAGPAHSLSDLTMLVMPERVLFAGDIVQNGRIPFMASAAVNTENWLAALELARCDAAPRHLAGARAPVRERRGGDRVYPRLHSPSAQVRQRSGRDLNSFEDAYAKADWSAYRDLPAFDASNHGNAYRVFLEAENASFAGAASPK